MGTILAGMDPATVSSIPQQVVTTLTSGYWFPQTLQKAFMPALRMSFIIGAVLSGIAALLSAMRGQHYVHETNYSIEGLANSAGAGEEKVQI